ncbi:hypothetical protein BJ878DRAFT_513864 [Calycina marina]|uniref:Phosphoglycerate mutase family protein n=1 Tax=Calycina marina TaxID=1763456 RepID=A0A9P8CDI1_9HELO|nr:hypothetical protein BJ878DRAFT_513864 [Calycina marina]
MGWPPAVVIVVRHGARLDAADKQWHLTSPTPYDPPLTYGGWNQSKALGDRIAELLRNRETDDEFLEGDEHGHRRKRRHKVVIHSSPFTRCVQTSVAISAGLAQNPRHAHHRPATSSHHHLPMHSSPRIRSLDTGSPSLAPIPEPGSQPALSINTESETVRKSTLRIDAFLGEWLTPDYYEAITSPPASTLMVASAKVALMKKDDYTYLSQARVGSASSNKGFPGGWQSPKLVTPMALEEVDPLSALPSIAQALPRRDRTSSLSSVGDSSTFRPRSPNTKATATTTESGVYQAPTLPFAASFTDPIPTGVVGHARDACVDVDYQWDSLREPQEWGSGGEYGEEWSSMHKRFRSGLQKMVSWYEETEDPSKILSRASTSNSIQSAGNTDEDTDLILILVTHGAGCNALIGAMTNQPVLMDVPLSSLTVAVRESSLPTSSSPTTTTSPRAHLRVNSRTPTVSEKYNVPIQADISHLARPSVSASSRVPSLAGIFRERETLGSSNDARRSTAPRLPRVEPSSGNFGSIRRAATVASSAPRNHVASHQGSIGLWGAPTLPAADEPDEAEDDMILNFGDDDNAIATRGLENIPLAFSTTVSVERDTIGPLGLWGSPLPPGEADANREPGNKRRWTITNGR